MNTQSPDCASETLLLIEHFRLPGFKSAEVSPLPCGDESETQPTRVLRDDAADVLALIHGTGLSGFRTAQVPLADTQEPSAVLRPQHHAPATFAAKSVDPKPTHSPTPSSGPNLEPFRPSRTYAAIQVMGTHGDAALAEWERVHGAISVPAHSGPLRLERNGDSVFRELLFAIPAACNLARMIRKSRGQIFGPASVRLTSRKIETLGNFRFTGPGAASLNGACPDTAGVPVLPAHVVGAAERGARK